MDRGGTSDPYVKIHVAEDLIKAKKTTVKNKTLNPTWMENFEFHIQGSQRREALTVEVRLHALNIRIFSGRSEVVGRGTDKSIVYPQAFDKDMVGTDDSLGKFCIGLDTLIPDQQVRFS